MGKVVVLGSINQDIVAVTQRHPQPGETVKGEQLLYSPGGKGANEAVAVASAGAASVLVGSVGKDAAGEALLEFLRGKGVDAGFVVAHPGVVTGTAIITVDAAGENSIVVITGANENTVDNEEVDLHQGDVVLSQFEVPLLAIQETFQRGRNAGCLQILNPSPVVEIPQQLLELTDVLIVNETELGQLTKQVVDLSNRTMVQELAESLLPHGSVVVTLGAQGVVAAGNLGDFDFSGKPVSVVDTTGAGDCFVGYLAAGLANGVGFEQALDTANRAASICVTRPGAGGSMPLSHELG